MRITRIILHNYDNNIALISRGYPADATRKNDGLIRFFLEFVRDNEKAKELLRNAEIPDLDEHALLDCFHSVPADENDWDWEFLKRFILNGQRILRASSPVHSRRLSS